MDKRSFFTLRFCGFRIWWRFWAALFGAKKMPSKSLRKGFASKNGEFLAHRFSGWVFLRCGARFWPITRGKWHFRTSWSGTKIAVLTFFGAFSLRCCALCGGNSHTPCGFARSHSEMSLHMAGFNLVGHQPPRNCFVFFCGLGGGSLYGLPKLCRKTGR